MPRQCEKSDVKGEGGNTSDVFPCFLMKVVYKVEIGCYIARQIYAPSNLLLFFGGGHSLGTKKP